MRDPLSPDLLRSFVAVAEAASFSAAARGLNLTQSAVSLHIKRLEARVEARLFDRTSRTVRLTGAGGALLPYARRLLRLQEAAGAAIGRAGDAPTVRLGITDEQAEFYLPKVLPVFSRAFPDTRLQVVCDLSPNLVARLGDGELDLALIIRHLADPPGGETIAIEELVWIAGAAFDLAPTDTVPLAVNPEGCTYRARALEALTMRDRGWRVMYESESPTGLNAAVASGLGVSIKARRSIPDGCRIAPATADLPDLPTAVVQLHRSPSAISPAHDGIADLLVAAVRA